MQKLKTLDIVCPVFNEEIVLPLFFEKLMAVIEIIQVNYNVRVLFIDNCSTDKTQLFIRTKCVKHSYVNLICLSKNFGYQASVECGLKSSNSDLTAIIDADGEDPPEMLLQFLSDQENGYEIVYGERLERNESLVIQILRKLYYRIVKVCADENFILDMAEFSLITSEVRSAVISEHNSFPFLRSSIARVGFAIRNVPYKRSKRLAGRSHYNIWKMFVFAFAGFLTSSTFLLRLPTYIAPFYCVIFASLSYYFLMRECINTSVYLYFISSSICLIFLFVVVMCLYIARIYKNSLCRKNFIIDTKKSFLQKA